MCKIGDILLIFNAKNSGIYSYDFIGLLLTSADTEEKKERLGKIEGNFPISKKDKILDNGR